MISMYLTHIFDERRISMYLTEGRLDCLACYVWRKAAGSLVEPPTNLFPHFLQALLAYLFCGRLLIMVMYTTRFGGRLLV